MSAPRQVEVVRVAAALRERVRAAAMQHGVSFADAAHALLERSVGIADGTSIIVNGARFEVGRKSWRVPRADSNGLLFLRAGVRQLLSAAAASHSWTLADETNFRIDAELTRDGQ